MSALRRRHAIVDSMAQLIVRNLDEEIVKRETAGRGTRPLR